MSWKSKISFVIIASLAGVLSVCLYFFDFGRPFASGGGGGERPTSSEEVSGEQDNTRANNPSGRVQVDNQIDNNIQKGSENVEVTNSIQNNIGEANEVDINNNIKNDINVNIDVNLKNDVKNNTKNSQRKDGKQELDKDRSNLDLSGNEVVWGVDSAMPATDEMIACVKENYGAPKFWGRYLDESGVSGALTNGEINRLTSEGIKILPLWSGILNATGFEEGKLQAERTIEAAKQLNAPENIVLFGNIEPNFSIDAAFIEGWYETFAKSKYLPGFYGLFDSGSNITKAFNQAVETNPDILNNTYLWTAAPNTGITRKVNAPDYKPESPDDAKVAAWQYGINGKDCVIDTNLLPKDALQLFW